MEPLKVLNEEDKAFTVEHAGNKFKVPKKDLSKETQEKYRKSIGEDIDNILKGVKKIVEPVAEAISPFNKVPIQSPLKTLDQGAEYGKEVLNQLGYLNPLEAARKFGAGEEMGWGQPLFKTQFNTAKNPEQPSPAMTDANTQAGVAPELPPQAAPMPAPASPMQPQMQPQMETISAQIPMSQGGIGHKGFDMQINAINKIAETETKKAVETEKLLGSHIKELESLQAKRANEQADYNIRKQQKLDEYEMAQKEAQIKVDPKRFWASASTGQKVAGYIGIVLSGIGGGMTGRGGNAAFDIINGAIDRDIAAQKQDIDNARNKARGAENTLAYMRQFYHDDESAYIATKGAMLQHLQLQLQKNAAQYDNPLIKERALLAEGQIKSEQEKLAAEFGLKTDHLILDEMKQRAAMQQHGVGKEPNDAQRNAAGFAVRVKQALKDFSDIRSKGYGREDVLSGIGSKFPNVLRGEAAVRQDQAERNFVNAVLRKESGAAISQKEFDNAEVQYFPRAGDSKGVLEQKERNRKASLAALEAAAGPRALQEASEGYGQKLMEETKTVNGKTYQKVPGGWKEVR